MSANSAYDGDSKLVIKLEKDCCLPTGSCDEGQALETSATAHLLRQLTYNQLPVDLYQRFHPSRRRPLVLRETKLLIVLPCTQTLHLKPCV